MLALHYDYTDTGLMPKESAELQLINAMDPESLRKLDLEVCSPTWLYTLDDGTKRKLFYATPAYSSINDEEIFQAVIVHDLASSGEEIWGISTFIAPNPGSVATEKEQIDRFFKPLESAIEPINIKQAKAEIVVRQYSWKNPECQQIDQELAELMWRDKEGRQAPLSEFYQASERSNKLHKLCVDITVNLARLLWDKSIDDSTRKRIQEELSQSGEQLADVGIRKGMHVGVPPEISYRFPSVMAEYVAGQLLPYTGYKIKSAEHVRAIGEEFEVASGILDVSDGIPEALENFYVDGWIVKNAMDFLDCEAEIKNNIHLP